MLYAKYRKPRIAMVLNGGGARGPFQIGVYLAMMKYGLQESIVATSGSSIGVFSEVMYLLKDPEIMISLWKSIDNSTIKSRKANFKLNLVTSTLSKKSGVFSREGLVKLINEKLDLQSLLTTKRPVYASLAETHFDSKGKIDYYTPKYIKLNNLSQDKIIEYMLATSAIPLVFDPVTIDGNHYVDPMKADNEPFAPLLDYQFDMLFILPLNDSHLKKVYPEDFPHTIVDFTCPQMMDLKMINMIDFNPESQDKYISLGYQTADLLFSLIKIDDELHAMTKDQLNHKKKYYSLRNFGISDIRFDIMSVEAILDEVYATNKKLNRKKKTA